MDFHKPVLVNEFIAHLNVKDGCKYIDATLGDGGHTIEILKMGGVVLGIDTNEYSISRATERINNLGYKDKFTSVKGNFKDIEKIAVSADFNEVDGIVFDLGYSSYQLDDTEIGLSFSKEAPLDMRLSSELQVTAADLLHALSEKDLTRAIYELSGETYAKRIAAAIVAYRKLKKFRTTKDLADLIVGVTSPGYERGRINPATRTFQALRILVNDELSNLEISLPRAAHLLLPGGRMIVISFHSLEDQIVKKFGASAQPQIISVTKKPLVPGDAEIAYNVRSRSAKMRVFEKVTAHVN